MHKLMCIRMSNVHLACGHACVPQVINAYRKGNKKMDEPLVMFYAIELLRAVEAMHAAGVLHCDIKPDNILLRDNDVSDSSWLYHPTQGFGAKGVELIDYGCAIDRNMYPADTVFHGRRFVCARHACACERVRVSSRDEDVLARAPLGERVGLCFCICPSLKGRQLQGV